MPNFEYPALGQDIFVAEEMVERMSSESLSEVLGSLWRGDCQTCGSSLASGPVSVYVEDLVATAAVSLHHPTCKSPQWNDSGVVIRNALSGSHTTYVHTAISDGNMPAAIVNPQLELAFLESKDGDWKVASIKNFGEFHRMFQGGPIPRPPASPAVGISVSIQGSSINVSGSGSEKWSIDGSNGIAEDVRRWGGILLAVSNLYHGQPLTKTEVPRILNNPARTALGWVRQGATQAAGAPAAEYVVYVSSGEACVGIVRARSGNSMLSREQAIGWGREQAKNLVRVPPSDLIDMPSLTAGELSDFFIDPISAKMFIVFLSEDGWRLVEVYSRQPAPSISEIPEWADSILIRKSPHRSKMEWRQGPLSRNGSVWISHALPTAS